MSGASPLHCRESAKIGNNIRSGCLTPTFSGAQKRAEVQCHPYVLEGPLQKGTETKVAHKWAEVQSHPSVLGGPLQKRTRTKLKVALKRAELLYHPYVLGGPKTRGQSKRWPTQELKYYITPAFPGVPAQGDTSRVAHNWTEVLSHPGVLGGPLQKGTETKVAHKWAEVLHHPCVLAGPKTRGQSQWWPRSGRKYYITGVFPGFPKQGDTVKGGPQVGGSATSTLRSGGSQNKGTKYKVAHKWAKMLHHPCVLGGPQTRGQSQRWPTSGQKCYVSLCSRGSPPQGDGNKSGPQVCRSAKSPLRFRGSLTEEERNKSGQKTAEVLHHPCVLGNP